MMRRYFRREVQTSLQPLFDAAGTTGVKGRAATREARLPLTPVVLDATTLQPQLRTLRVHRRFLIPPPPTVAIPVRQYTTTISSAPSAELTSAAHPALRETTRAPT
jgi:hypothetical protein